MLKMLDDFWPIITTPDDFPVFWNEKDSEAGIVPFVVIRYLLEFAVNGAYVLCFCCIFLFLLTFIINLTNMISFNQLQDFKPYVIVIKMTFSCLKRILEKCILLFCQNKVQNLVFKEVYLPSP